MTWLVTLLAVSLLGIIFPTRFGHRYRTTRTRLLFVVAAGITATAIAFKILTGAWSGGP